MIRVESNAEILLNSKDHTTPSKVEEFVVDGVGGGFVVVNLYGDYGLSVASTHVGQIGLQWPDTDQALENLCQAANLMSDQCTVTDLPAAGSAILLYLQAHVADTPANRELLWQALAKELETGFELTSILCLPGPGCTSHDLQQLYQAHQALQDDKAGAKNKGGRSSSPTTTTANPVSSSSSSNSLSSSGGDSNHSTSNHSSSGGGLFIDSTPTLEEPGRTRTRLGSFQVPDVPPVAAALVSQAALEGDCPLAKAAAQSAAGAVTALLAAKQWSMPQIVLVGLSPVTAQLYWLLTSNTRHHSMDVRVCHPVASELQAAKIPRTHWLDFDTAQQAVATACDVLVYGQTSPDVCPVLTEQVVDKLQCRAIVSAASLDHRFLPAAQHAKERSQIALERRGIVEFAADGLANVGAIAKALALSSPSNLQFSQRDLHLLGEKVMQKKLHLDGIVKQYDTEDKRKFYSMVLADELDDLGGLKLGLGTIVHNSSDEMTQWMWNRAKSLCPAFRSLKNTSNDRDVHFIDLGAGNGAAARWLCKQDARIHVKCINISPQQNAENRQLSDEAGLGGRISVETASFEQLPAEYSSWYDGVISQDAFIHAFSKKHALQEAFRVTLGGGWLMVSDLMCGESSSVTTAEELKTFAEKNNVQNWVTPAQYVAFAEQVGWAEVQFIDCTSQISVSLQNLLQKIKSVISSGTHVGLNLKLLQTHRLSLANRIGQIDRGVFKWGIIAARKPYDVLFMTAAPVTPDSRPMMSYSTADVDGSLKYGTDVVVLNIKDQMPRSKIMELPSTTRLIVTMSAGLDHIDMEAAKERGVRVRRAARFQIVKSVADYLLSNIIFGLRNGYQNVGVPFPGKSWDLSWNSEGVDLDRAKIGFIGMGAIAAETCRRIRALSTECELVFHIPDGIRCSFEEGTFRMRHVGIADLYSTCDVVIPMVPLTPTTNGLVDYAAFTMMKKTAIFINMARGKIVDTEGMLRALKEGLVRHAILDTTEPEPLPADHELWSLKNCTITPHFATNTTYVRKELVEDIPNEIEDTLDERGILRLEEQRLRKELSEAYRITRDFGLDELVWNHISAILSDGSYLITPGSLMFDDIGPEDLVKSNNSGNVTADIIHDAVYKARPDVKAIVHLHTPATVAVSCLEMGFVPLAQEAAPFVGRVARFQWNGVSNDWEEQAEIGQAIKNGECNTLLMENHGFCTFGATLGEAWVLAYYFDRACQTQLNCLQTGAKINYPNPQVLAHAAEQAKLPEFRPGNCEWKALRKMLTRQLRR